MTVTGEAWTPEELERAVKVEPMTGSEIVKAGLTGGWEGLGITDSVEWVEEQRRKRLGALARNPY